MISKCPGCGSPDLCRYVLPANRPPSPGQPSQRTYLNHWIARGVCLIFIPLCVYVASFKVHFLILDRSGPGDAQMSSLFQAHLRGNDFAESPLGVWCKCARWCGRSADTLLRRQRSPLAPSSR